MKRVLIAYYSRTGKTQAMAEYIAEGVRVSGNDAELKKISEIGIEKDFKGYDGFIFGCPTYHRDMTENMKTFLFIAQKGGLEGKAGGAFGSHTHSGDAAKLIFDTMEFVFKMDMVNLGPFLLKEDIIGTEEGLRACQQYGKALGEKLKS
ncbi:MAG: nitric oxide synthase [Deltaproteobacteria bacterium RBG_16_42_7]|nr:MAG: nitric oxide synthase [Deltaproteobacteria bacterium RBG_16_42_7]